MIYTRTFPLSDLRNIFNYEPHTNEINVNTKTGTPCQIILRDRTLDSVLGIKIRNSTISTLPAEKMRSSRVFAKLLETHRCIMPISGFIIKSSKTNMFGIPIPIYFHASTPLLCACIYLNDQYTVIDMTTQHSYLKNQTQRTPLLLDINTAKIWLTDTKLPRIKPYLPSITSETIGTDILWSNAKENISILNKVIYS